MTQLASPIAFAGGLIAFLVGIAGLWLGGRLMRIERATLRNAAVAAVMLAFLALSVAALHAFVPIFLAALGELVGLAGAVLVVKQVFETTWVRAVICLVIEVVLAWFAALLGLGSLIL
jgi:hypothetical protein